MKKVLIVILCVVFLLSSLSISAFAATTSDRSMKVTSSDGRIVNFTVKSTVKSVISSADLMEIANSNPGSTEFTIYGKVYAGSTTQVGSAKQSSVALAGLTYIGPVIKGYTETNAFESDRFMASCARGETKTVSSTITASLSPSYTGTALGGVGLNATISYSITSGSTLNGPPEGSSYNCREFRCKFYENRGNWAQCNMINGIPLNLSGTFKEPAYYLSYSVDRNV